MRHRKVSRTDQPAGSFVVALVQMSCVLDPDKNLTNAVLRIGEAASQGAHIVCLQELFRTPYFCQKEDSVNFDLAESIPGPSTYTLSEAARNSGVVVIATLFERRAAGIYHNTAVVLDADGALVGLYRKMHIPDDPQYYEKFYFTPGDLGYPAFDTSFGRIAVLICWDQWYPEAARLVALRGANILFYPSAIGWNPSEKTKYGSAQYEAWLTIQRSHAIANGVYVAVVNRVGHEGPRETELDFWGGSFVCDPFGRILAQGSHDCEEILLAECDLRYQEETRRDWPFLRDRRVETYGPLTRRLID